MQFKRHVYLLGGAGNVLFQLMKMRSISGSRSFSACPIFINPLIRRILGHTDHPNFYKDIVEVDTGGHMSMPFLLLDIFLYKLFSTSLFTVFDINSKKADVKPIFFDWLYLGYFQNDVNVFSVYESRSVVKEKNHEDVAFSLHIRGGDFVSIDDKFTSPLDVDYYRKAYISVCDYSEGINVNVPAPVVITNDRGLSKKIVSTLDISFSFSKGSSAAEDFNFLNSSKILICSNSTFALMAALTSNVIEVLVVPYFLKERFNNFEHLPFKIIFI